MSVIASVAFSLIIISFLTSSSFATPERLCFVTVAFPEYLTFIFSVRTKTYIVYAHGRRQYTFWFGHGSDLIVNPQCTIDLRRVVYKLNPGLDTTLNRIITKVFSIRVHFFGTLHLCRYSNRLPLQHFINVYGIYQS